MSLDDIEKMISVENSDKEKSKLELVHKEAALVNLSEVEDIENLIRKLFWIALVEFNGDVTNELVILSDKFGWNIPEELDFDDFNEPIEIRYSFTKPSQFIGFHWNKETGDTICVRIDNPDAMDFITADLKYLEALRIVDMDPVMKDIKIYKPEYFGDKSVWEEHGVKGYEYFLSADCFVNGEFVPLENDKWIGYRAGDRLTDFYRPKS